MMNTDKIVEDIYNFHFGNAYPIYLHERLSVRVGSVKNFERALLVHWHDPELRHDELEFPGYNTNILIKNHLHFSIALALAHNKLCCTTAILEHGVGFGCANDIDVILQFAIFGEVVYA